MLNQLTWPLSYLSDVSEAQIYKFYFEYYKSKFTIIEISLVSDSSFWNIRSNMMLNSLSSPEWDIFLFSGLPFIPAGFYKLFFILFHIQRRRNTSTISPLSHLHSIYLKSLINISRNCLMFKKTIILFFSCCFILFLNLILGYSLIFYLSLV